MKILTAIILGGIVAGAFDITYACVHYGMVGGLSPMQVFQIVASGVLGREAAQAGGWGSAMIGLGAHFTLTTIMAAAFVLASLALPILRRYAYIAGPIYGLALLFIMNLVVVPLSRAGRAPALPDGPGHQYLYGALFAHIILVGLSIALIAKAFGPPERSRA